jgi:hypothetical protein
MCPLVTFNTIGVYLTNMPTVRISEEHDSMVEEIQDDNDFHTPKKSIVESLIEDYYEENINE